MFSEFLCDEGNRSIATQSWRLLCCRLQPPVFSSDDAQRQKERQAVTSSLSWLAASATTSGTWRCNGTATEPNQLNSRLPGRRHASWCPVPAAATAAGQSIIASERCNYRLSGLLMTTLQTVVTLWRPHHINARKRMIVVENLLFGSWRLKQRQNKTSR